MKIFPAIDVKNGHCVKLRQGQFHDAEVFSHTPVKVAISFQQQGASYIHIVDLDGAFADRGINEEVIRQIIQAVSIPVQIGGGIRTIKDIDNLLNLGATRVVIGTAAASNPAFVKDAISIFGPDKIIVAIDGKNGMVVIEGWEKVSTYYVIPLAIEMMELGVKTIIYTDVIRENELLGPKTENVQELLEAVPINIIVSGGGSSLKELEVLDSIGAHGTIVGRALYENKLNLKSAIELFEKGEKK